MSLASWLTTNILCLTEHHLNQTELNLINTENYLLGSYYCRKNILKGGVCIFIHKSIKFSIINLDNHCANKDIEVCAIQLESTLRKLRVSTIYRSVKFNNFITQLDMMQQTLYKPKVDLIICEDININYLKNNDSETIKCITNFV
jgi:hypothetical protein